ncbi:MAG: hypothetical protein ACRD2B_07420 [Terriglobia bacterium]
MNPLTRMSMVAGICFSVALFSQPLLAQACKDPETVVTNIQQDLAGTVTSVRKESLGDFDAKFHQQATESKLAISVDTVNDVLSCLAKASHDTTVTKAELDVIKTKQATYSKLKTTLQQYSSSLKAAKDDKTAKAEIEKFNFGAGQT